MKVKMFRRAFRFITRRRRKKEKEKEEREPPKEEKPEEEKQEDGSASASASSDEAKTSVEFLKVKQEFSNKSRPIDVLMLQSSACQGWIHLQRRDFIAAIVMIAI
ncbi:hypothetical protein ANCDUO_18385 [Ancylostoma duodenale]|uniref:Uncharacterized protein n=1 Tax=Ancylostoma duodenale TaxID=51022 RepID=A0A0C2FY05_9BILA|nr:hypothetical protein ANCDUO_18385 [Ancylostoma duodenale]